MAHAGQSSTYVAFVLSIQYPIPGRICSIQPIPCCLLHPALPGHRSYPILNLESNLCRHLSHWLMKDIPRMPPFRAYLTTALIGLLALLSHDAISRPPRPALSPKPHSIHIPSTKYSLPAQMRQSAYLYPFPRIESSSSSFLGRRELVDKVHCP